MSKSVIISQATLPGLLPNVEAERLARSFHFVEENNELLISRMPTAVEREVMHKRAQEIEHALQPISSEQRLRIEAAAAIASLLVGYGVGRADKESQQTVTVYVKHLDGVPLFAIKAACADYIENRVFSIDPRSGAHIYPDRTYPPSTPALRAQAQKHVDALWHEQLRFSRALRARRAIKAEVDEAQRARIGAGLARLKEDLAANRGAPEFEREAEERRALRRQCFAAEAYARNARLIREEYAERGIDPVTVGGTMVSLGTAMKMAAPLYDAGAKTRRQAQAAPGIGEAAGRMVDDLGGGGWRDED